MLRFRLVKILHFVIVWQSANTSKDGAGLHAIAALHQGPSTTPIQEAGGHLVNVCMGIQGHFLRSEFVTHSFVCPYLREVLGRGGTA